MARAGCSKPEPWACSEWKSPRLPSSLSVTLVVGRELMPAVDWAKEAVLVVTMGEGGASLELKNARRVGLRTDVELALNWAEAGAAPCHVVALSKNLVNRLRLVNAEAAGLSAQVPAYQGRSQLAASNAQASEAVALSWGAVKDAYLQ